MYTRFIPILCCVLLLLFGSCSKEELVIVPDNDAPLVNHVPSIKIESYINRVFIDLLSREPVDEEMNRALNDLKTAQLSKAARLALIVRLQTGTEFIVGDTSYQRAYFQNLYDLAKIRCLEGVSDAKIDEVGGGSNQGQRTKDLLATRLDLQNGQIQIHQAFARMIDNPVYDIINMNSFNFVNASFDNLLWRFPTQAEFNAGFAMVDQEQSATLLGQTGQDKTSYIQILIQSREMFEGLLIWSYQQLLSRRPTSLETSSLLNDFVQHKDFQLIQRELMIGDEYANF